MGSSSSAPDRQFLAETDRLTPSRDDCSLLSQSAKVTVSGLVQPHHRPASPTCRHHPFANEPVWTALPYVCTDPDARASYVHADRTSSSKKLPSLRADAAADAARAVAVSASADASLATLCAAAAAATASLAASSAASSPPLSSPPSDDTARCADRDLAELRKQDRWPRERTKHCRGRAGTGVGAESK